MIDVLLANGTADPGSFLETHIRELTILVLSALVLGTVLLLVPRLLRVRLQWLQMQHDEHMKALEQGIVTTRPDDRSVAAGRTAFLVPMVVVIAAGTVTCFLAAYGHDNLLWVVLVVWSVAGVVSLAAITGGVALMGRLAQLDEGEEDEELPENPLGQ
jgi:hypothetical protein